MHPEIHSFVSKTLLPLLALPTTAAAAVHPVPTSVTVFSGKQQTTRFVSCLWTIWYLSPARNNPFQCHCWEFEFVQRFCWVVVEQSRSSFRFKCPSVRTPNERRTRLDVSAGVDQTLTHLMVSLFNLESSNPRSGCLPNPLSRIEFRTDLGFFSVSQSLHSIHILVNASPFSIKLLTHGHGHPTHGM